MCAQAKIVFYGGRVSAGVTDFQAALKSSVNSEAQLCKSVGWGDENANDGKLLTVGTEILSHDINQPSIILYILNPI